MIFQEVSEQPRVRNTVWTKKVYRSSRYHAKRLRNSRRVKMWEHRKTSLSHRRCEVTAPGCLKPKLRSWGKKRCEINLTKKLEKTCQISAATMTDEYEWQALPRKLLANCIFDYNVPPKELSGLSIFLGMYFAHRFTNQMGKRSIF